jgi:integrase
MRLPARIRRDNRTGVYHFRIVFPVSLRAVVGQRERWRSLRTKDPATARILAYRLNSAYVGGEDMANPKIEDILKNFADGNMRQLEARFPDGTVLRTDNPAEFGIFRKIAADYSQMSIGQIVEEVKAQKLALVKNGSMPFWPTAENWLNSIKEKTNPKTFTIKTRALVDFRDYLKSIGHPSGVAQIDATTCYNFTLALKEKGSSVPTRVNKMLYLAQFFDAMIKARIYQGSENPAKGHVKQSRREKKRAAKENGATYFTKSDLAKIFNPATYPRTLPHAFWAPLVALFTGCRVSEICQARVDDFMEIDGILCVLFTAGGRRQSVKTDASERLVPLHPKLRAMGLEKYIDDVRSQGEQYLFGYLGTVVNGMGDAASKRFTPYIKQLGIEAEVGRKTIHSFRDTVLSELKRKGVPADKRHQFVGHADDSVEAMAYTDEHEQLALVHTIHPVLSWDFALPAPYKSGEFTPYLIHNFAKAEKDKRHASAKIERLRRNGQSL